MRLFETAMSMVCYGAFGFAVTAAALIVSGPDAATGAAGADPQGGPALALAGSGSVATAGWPPLFGVAPAAPAPLTENRPDAPAPDYLVHGVVVNDTMQWALLSLDGVQVVVRAGDTLPGGEQVAAIGVGGIELLRGGRSFLLASGRSDPAPEAPPPAGGQGGSVQMAGTGAPPPAAPARHDEPEPVSVDVGRLDQRALERTFARAGKVRVVSEGAVAGLDVTWVRQGQLFDQIGLEVGDRIVTINGQKAVDQNGFSQAYEQAVRSGSLSLEVVREGALRTIRIALARI